MRNRWFTAASAAALVIIVALFATAVRVYGEIHPEARPPTPIDFASMKVAVEDVTFETSDGVTLRGWLLPVPDAPAPIILCHDLGQNRESLLNTALLLRDQGFTVLLFDFRGHGESGGDGSTLGLHEERDVRAAIEFLDARPDVSTRRVGLYGVGMGAHAAVLAAAGASEVRVLVLDSLYPDASFPLVREVFWRWTFAVRHLGFLPRMVFATLEGTSLGERRAADEIGRLPGRDLLLLAPAGDSALAGEMQRMYESIPDQEDVDGNLVILPATQRDPLYDERLQRYQERVTTFFLERLPATAAHPG